MASGTISVDDPQQFPPLDNLRLQVEQDGRKRSVAALHIGWAVNRTFSRYYSPPGNCSQVQTETSVITAREMWLDRMDLLEQDLMFLLKLPHNRFWSQVVYHEDLHELFNSYLLNAPRPHDLNIMNFTEEMRSKQNNIHHMMFLIYLRMATYKESKTSHITPSVFGTLIYDYFLFDIPKIMDLCTLFSANNKTFLQKMINNVFTTQPKYMDDLQNAICEIDKVYTSIVERFGLTPNEGSVNFKRIGKLPQPSTCCSLELSSAHFLDIFFYFVDTSCTLFSFLDVYPTACQAFFAQKFPTKIASLYSTIIPFLIKQFEGRKVHSEIATFEDILKLLGLARKSLLKTFRQIIESCCFKPLLEKVCVLDNGPCIDDYFDIMTSILSEKSFLVDYERQFSFSDDVDLLIQTGLYLDQNRISYITDGINMLLNECCNGLPGEKSSTAVVNKNPTHQISEGISHASNMKNVSAVATDLDEACAGPIAADVDLLSLVNRVNELLPDYEPAFIEDCLVYYNFEADSVINAVLENSLPPHLQKADDEPAKQLEKTFNNDHRANVYDNDEFDVFAKDNVDLSRIHKGKWRHQMKNLEEGNKNENLKKVTLALSAKLQIEERENREDLYEDDYDDTYDEQMISVNESVTWDELIDRRPFVTPNVLRSFNNDDKNIVEEDTPAEEETVQENVLQKRDEFVANPAIARERAAQYRRNVGQQRDVKGRPKGQGQDTQVTRNRDNKERSKTFHGNHNRRAMSERKRASGMFPT